MKNDKIINGFCYLDRDDVVFVSLFNEKKVNYNKSMFINYLTTYNINESYLFLVNENDGIISPLYNIVLNKNAKIKDMDFENIIKNVYNVCILITKKQEQNQ